MIKKWSALDDEIAAVNAAWEKSLERMRRKPERPEIRDKMDGVSPSEGLFGARWLMSMDEVSAFNLFTVTRHDSGNFTVDFATGTEVESFRPAVTTGEDYPQQRQDFQQYCLKISASASKCPPVTTTFKLIFTGQTKQPFIFEKN